MFVDQILYGNIAPPGFNVLNWFVYGVGVGIFVNFVCIIAKLLRSRERTEVSSDSDSAGL